MKLAELKWTEVAALSHDVPVVLPVAALEQHGHHLPVFTDSMLLGEVCRRVEETVAKRVLFAPLMWLGNSEHHLDFAGTMSASPRGYLDLLRDLVENMLFHGFKRIVILNGHGGNIIPAQQAMFELRQKYRSRADLLLLSTTYWTLGSEPNKLHADLLQNQMGHACEWETSMILRIAPQLVAPWEKIEPVPFAGGFAPAHRAWITKDRTKPGHIGSPHAASADKGERLFNIFTKDVVALLERMVAWNGVDWEG